MQPRISRPPTRPLLLRIRQPSIPSSANRSAAHPPRPERRLPKWTGGHRGAWFREREFHLRLRAHPGLLESRAYDYGVSFRTSVLCAVRNLGEPREASRSLRRINRAFGWLPYLATLSLEKLSQAGTGTLACEISSCSSSFVSQLELVSLV